MSKRRPGGHGQSMPFLVSYRLEEKMCLAVPGKVVSLEGNGTGKVDYLGTTVMANFSLLPEVKVGDWVIVHAGFAISRLDQKEARRTLKLFKELEKISPAD